MVCLCENWKNHIQINYHWESTIINWKIKKSCWKVRVYSNGQITQAAHIGWLNVYYARFWWKNGFGVKFKRIFYTKNKSFVGKTYFKHIFFPKLYFFCKKEIKEKRDFHCLIKRLINVYSKPLIYWRVV